MRLLVHSKWLLFLLLIANCLLNTIARGGRGGGGGRGGSSGRGGGGSRGSSSGSSSSSRGSSYGGSSSYSRSSSSSTGSGSYSRGSSSGSGSYSRGSSSSSTGSGSYYRGSSSSSTGYGGYSSGSSSSTGSGSYSSGPSSFTGYSSSSKGSSSFDYPSYRLSPPKWDFKPPEMPDFSYLNLGRARKADYPEKPLINVPKISYPGLPELPDLSHLNTVRIQNPYFPRQTNNPEKTLVNYPKIGSIPDFNYPRMPEMPSFSSFNRGWPDNLEKTPLNPPKLGSVSEINYPKLPEMPNFNSRNRDSIRITGARGSSNRGSRIQNGRGRGSSTRRGRIRNTNVTGGNYPRQPGTFQRPGGIPGANYPRQTYTSYPANSLGSNVWRPQSGRPAPVYMNYGGLPTGANMYTKPEKKKGFLGSLMSMGTPKNKKNKYFGSQPSPFAVRDLEGGFLGKRGSKAAMYTILPYMGAKKSFKLFKPRFRPSSFHRHHYHYGQYGHSDHYDIYNNDYAGSCNRPIAPKNGEIVCHATPAEVGCYVTCDKGYLLPDNTTTKTSKCWHVTGVWNPVKNFPDCKPAVCDKTCLNGGTCIGPDVCGCPPEYKGPRCEFYSLNCDIRNLTSDVKISWVCTQSNNETSCRVKCKTPFEFKTPTEEVYKCSQDGVWTPPTIPECISPDMAATTTETSEGNKKKI